jgi:hypothetical protein
MRTYLMEQYNCNDTIMDIIWWKDYSNSLQSMNRPDKIRIQELINDRMPIKTESTSIAGSVHVDVPHAKQR